MKLLEAYLNYLCEINPSVAVPLVMGGTLTGIQIAKMVDVNLKRKQCIKIAKRFKEKNKRNSALVRCYQSGGD